MDRTVSDRQHRLLVGAVGRKSRLTLFMEEGAGMAELLLSLTRDFAVWRIPGRPESLTVEEVRGRLEEDQ